MSFEFDSSRDPSLAGSNSDDYGGIMQENRLSILEGLPQATQWRSNPSQQVHKEKRQNSALLAQFLDSSVLRHLPNESQIFPWTFNSSSSAFLEFQGVDDDDCLSEEAVTSSAVENNNNNNNSRMVLGSSHFQILADRVLNSIEKLRVFYERIPDMARVEEDDDGYGDDSENLQQTRFSPLHSSIKVADSLSKLQTCENGRVIELDASFENPRSGRPVVVAEYGKNSCLYQEYWQHQQQLSQTTEESLTWQQQQRVRQSTEESLTEGGPGWGMEEGGGDSNSKSSGVKRSGSKADSDGLLSSLRCLLFVLKNHEENEQLLRSRLQVLRGRKDALHLQKQQYKDIHKDIHKRQRVSEC